MTIAIRKVENKLLSIGGLEQIAKALYTNHCSSVFMSDRLPVGYPHKIECGVP